MGKIDSRPVCATHERFATIRLWIRILRIARPISSFSANCSRRYLAAGPKTTRPNWPRWHAHQSPLCPKSGHSIHAAACPLLPKADSCTAAIDAQRLLRFNTDRGFGFILPDDGGTDVFVHHDVEAAGMKTFVAGAVLVLT